jgi:hypothetical protein
MPALDRMPLRRRVDAVTSAAVIVPDADIEAADTDPVVDSPAIVA